MRRMITVLALAATMLLATASLAMAAPNANAGCLGWANHGEHIKEYVAEGIAAGGGPAHFDTGYKPGASFCQGENSSKPIFHG